MRLFHYTCEHGRAGIGDNGWLRPAQTFWGGEPLIWLTDMDVPDRVGLGLTSHILSCDRLDYRYVVEALAAYPWLTSPFRIAAPWFAVVALEGIEGVKPHHWFVSDRRLRARFDTGYAKRGCA